jgi:hypothetical protein
VSLNFEMWLPVVILFTDVLRLPGIAIRNRISGWTRSLDSTSNGSAETWVSA